MKTVFLTISRGTLARNILRSGVLDSLTQRNDLKIVILLSNKWHDYFEEEFKHPRITLEALPNNSYSRFRKFFIVLFNGLVYAETEHRKIKYGGADKGPDSRPAYYLKHYGFKVLSKPRVLKRLARWMEQNVFIEKDFDYLFEKYNPDLLFCSTIYSKQDAILIKAAKRFGVVSLSMPKSWDTIGRLFFRVVSDKVILNNEFMKGHLVKDQLIDEKDVFVSGFPQFDVYKNKTKSLSREVFCKATGLDPKKPIVLFASEGAWTKWDWIYIEDLIENCDILDKYNLVIRPHFSNFEERLYDRFKNYEGVYVDDENIRITNMFVDHWDPSVNNMEWLGALLENCDVVITFMSTFVLDAFVNGKPVINIYYDPPQDERLKDLNLIPMEELYKCVHYNAVMDEKPTAIARTGEEVMEWIERYLHESDLHFNERKNAVNKLCYMIDGRAAERIVKVINKFL